MKCHHCGIELVEKENWFPCCKKLYQYICKDCYREKYRKPWIAKNKEKLRLYSRDWQRKWKLGQGTHTIFLKKPKRPFPLDSRCELCNAQKTKLHYHHWNDKHPEIGIWICPRPCHILVEELEKENLQKILQKYTELKKLLSP